MKFFLLSLFLLPFMVWCAESPHASDDSEDAVSTTVEMEAVPHFMVDDEEGAAPCCQPRIFVMSPGRSNLSVIQSSCPRATVAIELVPLLFFLLGLLASYKADGFAPFYMFGGLAAFAELYLRIPCPRNLS